MKDKKKFKRAVQKQHFEIFSEFLQKNLQFSVLLDFFNTYNISNQILPEKEQLVISR